MPRPVPAAPLTAAPDAWQLLDITEDRVPGAAVNRAYREILDGRRPERTVVVAIIDSGVDTSHVDLRASLWNNPGETPGNGQDDDGNGYVDDAHGWNFIGGPEGRNVEHETFEVTRLYAACQGGGAVPAPITCDEVTEAFETRRLEVTQTLAQIQQIDMALGVILPVLRDALGGEEPTVESVRGIESADASVVQAKTLYLQLSEAGLTAADLAEAREAYQGMADFGLNVSFDPRDIVGDDPSNGDERMYGNRDVTGPDASHGTHVAGIVAAGRGNGIGMDGIASGVQLMIVRAVPDGDERDKDIANAIRYAVDNGADILNMSFGKAFSPQKDLVDASIRYADERGVLMIHAAGNDGEDMDAKPSYPTPEYSVGGSATNWISVGAAHWAVDSLAAAFSNYGQQRVDLFAPGVAILSTVPGGDFDRNDGTSMAAPVVTGVAALLMAYFPDLTAADVRRILLESAVNYGNRIVQRPGTGEPVRFRSLSATGGVVNAYEAVRMATEGR
ncbi:MAG: S8 family peptidase [Gemmatimonadota bacterium]|nr:S8 family peptidase [Gemmatimonadota bacterium]